MKASRHEDKRTRQKKIGGKVVDNKRLISMLRQTRIAVWNGS